jgi:hypothetical protein
MIGARAVELTLWASALSLSVFAGVRARSAAASRPEGDSLSLVTAPPAVPREQPQVLLAASEILVARDPFRLERRPSGAPYSPTLETAPPPPPRAPRPALAITGIVGGPPWEALLEGVPGRQGSVLVRLGDTLGGLRIRSVTKDSVTITGMDTTWVLAVRRAWQ